MFVSLSKPARQVLARCSSLLMDRIVKLGDPELCAATGVGDFRGRKKAAQFGNGRSFLDLFRRQGKRMDVSLGTTGD
jgi:hypothetical protein